MDAKEFLNKQDYTRTINHPQEGELEPSFSWDTVVELLERYKSNFITSLPDECEVCKHFSVTKDYKPDGAPYEPETAIKNKYRREGAIWYNNLVTDQPKTIKDTHGKS